MFPDVSLELGYDEEPLEQCQIDAYNEQRSEYEKVEKQLDDLKAKGTVILDEEGFTVYEIVHTEDGELPNTAVSTGVQENNFVTPTVVPTIRSPQGQHVLQQALIAIPAATSAVVPNHGGPKPVTVQSTASVSGGYQLLVDSTTGIILGTVGAVPPNATIAQKGTILANNVVATIAQQLPVSIAPKVTTVATGPKLLRAPLINTVKSIPAPLNSGNFIVKKSPTVTPAAVQPVASTNVTPAVVRPVVSRTLAPAILTKPNGVGATPLQKPKQICAEGEPKTIVKISSASDGTQGKTFPSLVIVVRPGGSNEEPPSRPTPERLRLDAQIKSVLAKLPAKFTEWLMQNSLLRREHFCPIHVPLQYLQKSKLQLAMYSDTSSLPYSGGYVYVTECCRQQRFVSVFKGSIFEESSQSPVTILKLIYHWACQTKVASVAQWVKVDNCFIKNFYASMRCICVTAVHEKFEKFGGRDQQVQVGVISLGTISPDGNQRQVKVEVLGVMDKARNLLRFRAVEPPGEDERNSKKRFMKILHPLVEWVDLRSKIVTDQTVDKDVLTFLGFQNVFQNMGKTGPTNQDVMQYLRQGIPKMFQNTLSLLSRSLIQQFLDELVWRERWGNTDCKAFNNIILHLGQQTNSSETPLIARLNKIAMDPFQNWGKSTTKPPGPSRFPALPISNTIGKQAVKRTNQEALSIAPRAKIRASNVSLESYYYGFLDKNGSRSKYVQPSLKCPLCKKTIQNNIEVVRHLGAHVNTPINISSDQTVGLSYQNQCTFCMKHHDSPTSLESHVEQMHIFRTVALVCRICHEKFPTIQNLVQHMNKKHVEREMPYACPVCGYRCSLHFKLIDHFVSRHSGSADALCPFCLMLLSTKENSLEMVYLHLKRHMTLTRQHHCNYCVLTFLDELAVINHESQCHSSLRNDHRVKDMKLTNFSGIPMMIPVPPTNNTRPMRSSQKSYKPQETHYTVTHFGYLMQPDFDDVLCSECTGLMNSPAHYPGYQCCKKCNFATCCKAAMTDHLTSNHDSQQKLTTTRSSLPVQHSFQMESPLHCVCGAKYQNGDQLARHLTECDRKSAYPSEEAAKENTVIPGK